MANRAYKSNQKNIVQVKKKEKKECSLGTWVVWWLEHPENHRFDASPEYSTAYSNCAL